jgi:competence protein ComEC
VLALLRSPALGSACAGLALAGAAVGAARLDAIDAPATRLADGAPLRARAFLLERPRRSPFGRRAEIRLVTGRARGARLLARAGPGRDFPSGAVPGAELRIRGLVRRLPAKRGFAEYLRRRGVAGELWLDGMRRTGRRRGGVPGVLDAMRGRAERGVAAGLAPAEAALARGMVLGQDEAIAAAVREDWRASGLAHLLAVSGQNVMLLAALAAPGLAALGLPPGARAAALLLLIALYVPLAGAGPSLQRAGVMGAAGAVAIVASRPASRWYALLLAAAATLALNPRAWSDPGWQLSFAAVTGILALAPPLRGVLGARRTSDSRGAITLARASLAEGAAVTAAATVATAPLLAHHFGSVPLASLPANLLALPAVAPAMWLGMLKIAAGQAAALGGPLAAAGAGATEALGVAARAPLGYLGWVAERFAALPGARLRPPLEGPAALFASYALLAAGTLVVRRGATLADRVGARVRALPRRTRTAVAVAACAALALLAVRALAPPLPPRGLTVSFLDVGQGDATLVQHPDGTAVLFDGGPPEAGVTRLLRRAGVRRLAAIVATHASRDHHGGLRDVLRRHRVGVLLDGGDGSRDPAFRALLAEADRRGVRRLPATAPMSLSAGGLRIRVLSPRARPPGPPPEDPNPRAVVAVVSAGGFDLLLSGDAESEALAPLDLPDVDAMKVPHHGSADPGLPAVLERLRPEVAAIEVGPNTYGHPAPSTLAALERARVRTWRTDRHGTIRVSVEGGRLRTEPER